MQKCSADHTSNYFTDWIMDRVSSQLRHPSYIIPVTSSQFHPPVPSPSSIIPVTSSQLHHPSSITPVTSSQFHHPSYIIPVPSHHPSSIAPVTSSQFHHPSYIISVPSPQLHHPSYIIAVTSSHADRLLNHRGSFKTAHSHTSALYIGTQPDISAVCAGLA